jgi:Rrf2 family protein
VLKLTKKADYGLIALKHLAESDHAGETSSAKDIADAYDLPQEALAKILQKLVKTGMLRSVHGTNGGYVLAKQPKAISAYDVIRAIDGPMFFTVCSTHVNACDQSSKCNVKEPLAQVSASIRQLLMGITIADMMDKGPRAAADEDVESKALLTQSNLVTLT